MELVASKAGVAKSTLYRRWPSKVELAVHAVAATFDTIDTDDRGSLAADMRAGIEEPSGCCENPRPGRVCRSAGRVGA